MLNPFKKKSEKPPQLNREQSLKSIPIHNVGITEEGDAQQLRISFKRKAPAFANLIKKFNLPQPEKTIILDEMGTFIWRLIDGKKTTNEIIELFRKQYPLPRREAEAGVTAHLKNLMVRGAISLVFK